MLKILIIICFSLNLAFANSRFNEDDKKKFMLDVKQEITVHKMENKGVVDLQIIKPSFYEGLDDYSKQEKLTREEVVRVKQRYEDFSKNRSLTPANTEEEFYKFIETQLNEISKTQVSNMKEGQVCNNWSCENGLKCAVDPRQEDGKSCKKEGNDCRDDKDCCSSTCSLNKNTKKKTCDAVYTCFKPLGLGQSCLSNPVCGEGECLSYNSKTSGIGECEDRGRSCKNNSDCCSNSCNQNKCIDAYVCKDCVKNGKKADRGQKCCEGLYMNDDGVCAPDVPPIVFPQVKNKFHILNFVASLIINTSDAAQTPEQIATQMAAIINAKSISNADITAALSTFAGTPAEEAQLKDLASQDSTLQAIYDKELAARAAEEKTSANAATAATATNTAISSKSDNLEMTSEIMSNKAKFESFKATSTKEKKDITGFEIPEMKFKRQSNFETCDILFRDDFANYLKKSNLVNLELALLSFDYVFLGDGINDYWMQTTSASSSIYGRLKKIAINHQKIRTDTNKKMDDINEKLTCMCIDAIGYNNFKGANADKTIEKKKFFEEKCPEFKVNKDGETCSKLIDCTSAEAGTSTCVNGKMPESCASGDAGCTCTGASITSIEGETASGIKGKRLIVDWTNNLEIFNASLAVDNTKIYQGISEVSTWSSNVAKWNDAKNIKYNLFNFNLKKPSGSVAAMGAILGALLAAAVIAVLGGFASTSILTAWAAAGIIATSAITGGTGLWLIASLKGAWITKRPEIYDKFVRQYTCGKKETCQEWSRELNQPFNDICNVHTSANACVKNFVVYNEAGESRYLVDPWIPKGVNKSLILRDLGDARNYAEKMEDGFQTAKAFMLAKDPHAYGGNYVAEEYMKTIFIDANVLGKYTPKIGLDDKRYLLSPVIIEAIKSKARQFAIDERFFEAGDTENLKNFSDYTYKFHFLWPKTSRTNEISYPTIGLTTYLELMTNGVAANMATGATNAAKQFGNLNSNYLQDYLNTLKLYKDLPSNQSDAGKMALINGAIAKTQAELDSKKAFSSIMNNANLDSQLLNLSQGANPLSKINGGSGNLVLTSGQAQLLNAIGVLRLGRKAQLKKLDSFKRAIAKNNNPDRAIKIASVSKNFAAGFAKPLSKSSFGGGSSPFGSGGKDGVESGSLDNSDSTSKKNNESGGYDSGYSGSSNSGSSGHTSSAGDNSGHGSVTDSGKDGSVVSNPKDEDARNLTEAIEARNRLNKKQYQTNEDQTIFEQVTNAYIRNYDKVLLRKSEKDVSEQKK